MAWQWTYDGTPNDSVNLAVANGSVAIYNLKETLKQAGWAVKSSGDGTSNYDATGDTITSSGGGLHGMANANAWFRIQSPAGAGGREYTFQRGGGNQSWRCKYSASAGFTGGTPDFQQTPSATDQQILLGSGTDGAPNFSIGLSGSASRVHIGTQTAAPYDWYLLEVENGSITAYCYLLGVGLVPGLYPSGDADPWITGWTVTNPSINQLCSTSTGLGSGYYKKGLVGEAFVKYRCYYDSNYPTNFPVNPITGNDEAIPMPVGRNIADGNGGTKGWVSSIKVLCTAGRQITDYMDDAGPPVTRWAYFGALALPYPTSVTPTT
jgi:hypothetical protein